MVKVMEHDVEAPSGGLREMLRAMGFVDAKEAARIKTLRAAAQGDYHLYTPASINKDVQNSQIQVAERIGGENYYRLEDIETMSFKPRRARRSWTPDRLRDKIKAAKEMLALQLPVDKEEQSKETRTQIRKLQKDMAMWQEQLPLAKEAEKIVKAYWKRHAQHVAQVKKKQQQQEPPPAVANV